MPCSDNNANFPVCFAPLGPDRYPGNVEKEHPHDGHSSWLALTPDERPPSRGTPSWLPLTHDERSVLQGTPSWLPWPWWKTTFTRHPCWLPWTPNKRSASPETTLLVTLHPWWKTTYIRDAPLGYLEPLMKDHLHKWCPSWLPCQQGSIQNYAFGCLRLYSTVHSDNPQDSKQELGFIESYA